MTSSATHSLGMVVQVLQVLPFGVLVLLGDKRTGIIRQRELAWHADDRYRWYELFKPGDTLEAVFVDASDDGDDYPELSVRLAQRDPWTMLERRYPAGHVCHGVVTQVAAEQTLVEIEPGVRGTLFHDSLPTWAQHCSCSELFWPGDHVMVSLDGVDTQRRQVHISMTDTWSQHWASNVAMSPLDQHTAAARIHLHSIAVVTQQDAIAPWIVHVAPRLVTAASVEHALALLHYDPPAVLLVHQQSPNPGVLAGLHQACDTWPQTRCVLLLERAALALPADELDQLAIRGVQVLLAPLRYEDWQEALIDNHDLPVQPYTATEMRTLDHVGSLQRLAMLGQLTRAFVHEINHHVSPVTFALYDLQSQYARIQRRVREAPAEAATDVAQAHEALGNLDQGVQQLLRTVRLFRQVASLQHKPDVSSDEIIRDAVDLVRDLTDREHIVVTLESAKLEPILPGSAVPLRQIILSLLLYTIQQFARLRPDKGGRIQIRSEQRCDERGNKLYISIEDDGPGVHRWLWEYVFEPTYITSRDKEGTGLPITHSQIEALGGRIYVAESSILWGTRVMIELPLDS